MTRMTEEQERLIKCNDMLKEALEKGGKLVGDYQDVTKGNVCEYVKKEAEITGFFIYQNELKAFIDEKGYMIGLCIKALNGVENIRIKSEYEQIELVEDNND